VWDKRYGLTRTPPIWQCHNARTLSVACRDRAPSVPGDHYDDDSVELRDKIHGEQAAYEMYKVRARVLRFSVLPYSLARGRFIGQRAGFSSVPNMQEDFIAGGDRDDEGTREEARAHGRPRHERRLRNVRATDRG